MFVRKGVKRVESIESDEAEAVANEGFSLEELGTAYAVAIEQASGETRISQLSEQEKGPSVDSVGDSHHEEMLAAPDATETDGVPVTPESILEAMLFLGSSNNRPIAINKLLELFRGVTAEELEDSVDSLNALYRQHNRAMVIVRASGGYHMQLAPELNLVRDRFYGKVKETQLTQAAIDCLSLVAYQPGATRDSIEKQWNQPAAGMLSTLVRKGLLRIEKRPAGDGSGEGSHYFTTDRFLEIIGLESLEDLPSSEDI
ncbi:MAG: SMC-Scp complex subunit ScpB [Planctomycetota bacterium]|jgi:segregation and condensation protein B|nr:SMC-Scp complex subunit ScpB [Planctomycetota bacterium]